MSSAKLLDAADPAFRSARRHDRKEAAAIAVTTPADLPILLSPQLDLACSLFPRFLPQEKFDTPGSA